MVAGVTLQKLAPWRMRNFYPAPTASPKDPASVRNAIAHSIRQQAYKLPSTTVSGYVDLNGRMKFMPKPKPGMTWPQWLQNEQLPPMVDMWATEDGRYVPCTEALSGQSIILRLHFKLRGGGKQEAVLQKLMAHLTQKGVPNDAVEPRAKKIVAAVGYPALESVYQALDPWSALKSSVKDKVRLVLPEELRAAKAKTKKPREDRDDKDPWESDDPWKQAKARSSSSTDELKVVRLSLVQDFFVDEDGDGVQLLQHVSAQSTQVALLDVAEAETIASTDTLLSDDPLAAVVVGVQRPDVGKLPCSEVTFPAMHGDQKVLLRGFLVNYGARLVKPQAARHSIDMQVQDVSVLAVEIRREFASQWDVICSNPLKFAFQARLLRDCRNLQYPLGRGDSLLGESPADLRKHPRGMAS